MVDKRGVVLLLLVALAASNAVWATLYTQQVNKYNKLLEAYSSLNETFTLLAKRAAKLEDNNTALLLQIKTLRERLRRLAELVTTANETLKEALVVTRILENLNASITELFKLTYPRAYYTQDVRQYVTPGRVADIVMEVVGVPLFNPKKALKHMEMLYNYTVREVKTSPDHPFVVISDVKYVDMNGKKYVYAFKIKKTDNYIQTPLETLIRKAGDCEDKAILLTSLYLEYLGSFGDAWVMCFFGKEGYNHCVSIAYVKPLKTFVIADPTLEFFETSNSVKNGIDKLFAYIGLRWSDIDTVLVFNNKVYQRGDIYTVMDYLENIAR
ncbi:hypothetical protein Pyrfu_0790 [Pyrolobus fumarii 1A]|uniref:Transglutaminase-like domain-containing protein n=1 Tax=Pyrolobus fumarii (strain DSM 11204 / 1A) TaxID=694429 RepID=G0EDH4_PYRF1|nr:hypothetical protein [Pyrolobus fumarii]AEM38659.1 hypothetical protein Pyrfu_0790 [Pyrolobus fumarii 1A]